MNMYNVQNKKNFKSKLKSHKKTLIKIKFQTKYLKKIMNIHFQNQNYFKTKKN